MKVLITGGTSSVANAVRSALAGHADIITAGRKGCDIALDLNDDLEAYTVPEGIDVVIHTAAQFGGKSDKDILTTENVNVLGTLKLCQAAKQAKVKNIILVSSMYSSLQPGAWNYGIYSLSKRHAEELASLYCAEHGIPLAILRPSQLYGVGAAFKKHQPFLYTLIEKARLGEDIQLYGSNDARRNYLYIDDLAQIIKRVAEDRITGNFSCTYPRDVTYSEIARAAYMVFNTRGEIHFLKDKPDIPDSLFDKDDRLYRKIGFFPLVSIEEGIKRIATQPTLIK